LFIKKKKILKFKNFFFKVKQFTLPYNAAKACISGVHVGLMPSRVVVGFLNNSDFTGTFQSNPFNFQHLDIKKLTLKMSSKAVPYSSGVETDFEGNCYQEGYRTLYQNIHEAPMDISYSDYKNGYTLWAFNLSSDLTNCEHFNPFKDGSLDLDIDFKNALSRSITTIFYLEFESLIELTKQRNVVFDYQV
jgi:hypothetical protein